MNFFKKIFKILLVVLMWLPAFLLQAQSNSLDQLMNQSMAAIQKEDYKEAAEILQQVLAKDANNITALSNASYVYYKLKNYPSAIECNKKLIILQPYNANNFTNTGWYLILNKEYKEAESYCLQALDLNNCSYSNYLNLGHVYSFLKQQNKGLEYYYKAVSYMPNKGAYESILADFDLFEKEENFPYKISNYKNMVVSYYNEGFLKRAYGTNILDSIYQMTVYGNYSDGNEKINALKERFLVEENKNDKVRLQVLRDFYGSLGWLHLHNDSKSISMNEYLINAIKISSDLKDTSYIIDVLYKVGAEFDLDAGVNLIKQALDLAVLSKNYNKQFIINLLLGDKSLEKHQPEAALNYFRKTFVLAKDSEIKEAKNIAANRLMLVFQETKQSDSVGYYYTVIKKENLVSAGSSENAITDDFIYCSFLTKSGKYAAAIKLANEVIGKYANQKDIDLSGMYEQLGKTFAKQDKTDSAQYYFRRAISNYIQFIKNNPEFQSNAPFKERYACYVYLKEQALTRKDIKTLFDLSEQTKAGILYPKLSGHIYSPESISLNQLADDLKADEVALSFSSSGMTNIAYGIGISKDATLLLKENDLLFETLITKHKDAQWTSLKQKANDILDPLKKFTDAENLKIFNLNLFIVIAGGLNNMMQAGTTRGVIKLPGKKSVNYAAEILAYNDIIYQLYIKPFEKILEGKKTIYLSPDIGTTLIPFEAIKNEQGEYLGNLYNIIYVPSFTSRAILKSTLKPANKLMLAAGNPVYNQFEPHNTRGRAYDLSQSGMKSFADLPGTAKELLAIEKDVPGVTILDGNKLTETALKNMDASGELGRYAVLHFAVHGISSIDDYRDNTLIVSEPAGTANDGFLQYNEIANLHLNAGLVCLSACETAVGIPSGNEDVKNLPTAFFIAGAHAVIATWWKIDDEATGLFMASFYSFVFKENKSYAEALMLTRQKFISGTYGERYKSPYFWAAFKYFGN